MLKAEIEKYAAKEPLERFVPVEIDIDTPEGDKVATKYKVQGIPDVVFIDPEGKELYRFIGPRDQEGLAKEFAKVP